MWEICLKTFFTLFPVANIEGRSSLKIDGQPNINTDKQNYGTGCPLDNQKKFLITIPAPSIW